MMLEMVSGETVCVWNLVCGEGFLCVDFRGASGREILGKEGGGKDGLHGFVGGEGHGKAKGKQKGARCGGLARRSQKACVICRGDNGWVALPWKCESARLASFKVAESRARHSCWDWQVGSQPMEANIRPCEYT